jgi:hypothetical protein
MSASKSFTLQPVVGKVGSDEPGGVRQAVFLEFFHRGLQRVVKASGDVVCVCRLRMSGGGAGAADVDADAVLVHVHRPHVQRSTLKRPFNASGGVSTPVSPFATSRSLYGGDCLALCDAWHEHVPCDAVVLSDTLVLVHSSSILSPCYVVPRFADTPSEASADVPSRRVNAHLLDSYIIPAAYRPVLYRIGPLH